MDIPAQLDRLARAVLEMDGDTAGRLTEECLATGIAPQRVIADGLSAGMREVGVQFKTGEIYMPEVLVSCDAYYRGLNVVRPALAATPDAGWRGRLVLGTIHGDIHTVGKDVAIPVFQAAGYEVIDLGIDVADAAFVEAIRRHQPDLVGLGTYMTSTFMHARETVRAIAEAGLRDGVRIICGGPSVDPRAARTMGADDASDDAWEAVDKLDRLLADVKKARA